MDDPWSISNEFLRSTQGLRSCKNRSMQCVSHRFSSNIEIKQLTQHCSSKCKSSSEPERERDSKICYNLKSKFWNSFGLHQCQTNKTPICQTSWQNSPVKLQYIYTMDDARNQPVVKKFWPCIYWSTPQLRERKLFHTICKPLPAWLLWQTSKRQLECSKFIDCVGMCVCVCLYSCVCRPYSIMV